MLSFAGMDLMHKISFLTAHVAVGHHRGDHTFEEEALREEEKVVIRELSPRKQSEWLASRELLYQIAGLPDRAQCLYDSFGKPYLKGINKHISVSHSELWCAAMVCDRPCGVDIQVYSETVRRISDRFLNADDLDVVQKSKKYLQHLHLLWGAKECLYKAYGKRKLGFREHIFIPELDLERSKGLGEIRFEGLHLYYDLYFRLLPEAAWVFCHEHPADVSIPR